MHVGAKCEIVNWKLSRCSRRVPDATLLPTGARFGRFREERFILEFAGEFNWIGRKSAAIRVVVAVLVVLFEIRHFLHGSRQFKLDPVYARQIYLAHCVANARSEVVSYFSEPVTEIPETVTLRGH